MREKRNTYRVLVGKLEGKRSLGRSRCRWYDNVKMHYREVGSEGMVGLIWLRMGISGGLLRTLELTFRFCKMLGNS
jgi:hypothetical protein